MSSDPPAPSGQYRPGRGPSKIQDPGDTKIEREIMERIEYIRKLRGHTHESIGRALGYSKQGYAAHATGKVRPRVDQLARMAEVLGAHLHIAIREGATDRLNALERAAMGLSPEALEQVIRIAESAGRVPLTMLSGTADYMEMMAKGQAAAPAPAPTTESPEGKATGR